MNVGMLWFDNDSKVSLERKVERAASYYRNKYGKSPTLCFVHPSMLPEAYAAAEDESQSRVYTTDGIEVRSNRSVLPNHFWIGVNGFLRTSVA
jgi:hypothetical protein